MLTAAHRLAVIRELWAFAYHRRFACGFRMLWEFERSVKEAKSNG